MSVKTFQQHKTAQYLEIPDFKQDSPGNKK